MSTKTNERRLNITPGTWSTTQVVYDNYPTVQVFAPFYGEAVHWRKPKAGHTRAERDQQNADAELIADAGATANEVDLLPSELLAKLRAVTTEIQGATVSVQALSYLDHTRYAVVDLDDWNRILSKLNLKP
jgi:hypothetical protein